MAQNDVLLAFVNVPQSTALQIRKGMKVKVTVASGPAGCSKGWSWGRPTTWTPPIARS